MTPYIQSLAAELRVELERDLVALDEAAKAIEAAQLRGDDRAVAAALARARDLEYDLAGEVCIFDRLPTICSKSRRRRWYLTAAATRQFAALVGLGDTDAAFDVAEDALASIADTARHSRTSATGLEVYQGTIPTRLRRGREYRIEMMVSTEPRPDGDLPQLVEVTLRGSRRATRPPTRLAPRPAGAIVGQCLRSRPQVWGRNEPKC